MLQYLLKKYKRIHQQGILQQPLQYKKKYAIVGTGIHSLTNLYPCIWHLGLPVKTVYSATLKNAEAAAARFNDCTGTDSIDTIINDADITGVIVALPPGQQAGITKLLLENGKQVFTEKPVGFSGEDLRDVLSAQKNNICQPGLQRRFSAVMDVLRKECKDATGYNYRFLVGAYPEGNCIYDLFIHPVDFILQLFGKATIAHTSIHKDGPGMTCYLVLDHGPVKGSVELSTQYTWQQPVDEIVINTTSKIFTASYPNEVSAVIKPVRFFNLPVEKVIPRPLKKEIYLENTFVPTAAMNSLRLQGFYPQLKHFAVSVERGRPGALSSLESLLPVYDILDKL